MTTGGTPIGSAYVEFSVMGNWQKEMDQIGTAFRQQCEQIRADSEKVSSVELFNAKGIEKSLGVYLDALAKMQDAAKGTIGDFAAARDEAAKIAEEIAAALGKAYAGRTAGGQFTSKEDQLKYGTQLLRDYMQVSKGVEQQEAATGDAIGRSVVKWEELVKVIKKAASELWDYAKSAIETASRLEQITVVAELFGQRIGMSTAQVDSLIQSIKNLGTSGTVAAEMIADLGRYNIDLSKGMELAKVAFDLSAISGMKVSDTFDRLIHGIVTLQTRTLRYIGLHVSLVGKEEEYAASIGKAVEQLTAEEREMVMINAILEEGTKIQGAWEKSLELSWGRGQLFSITLVRIKEALGSAFLEGYSKAINAAYDFAKAIENQLLPGKDLYNILKTLGEKLGEIAEKFFKSALDAIPKWVAAIDSGATAVIKLADGLDRISDYTKNMPELSAGITSVGKALGFLAASAVAVTLATKTLAGLEALFAALTAPETLVIALAALAVGGIVAAKKHIDEMVAAAYASTGATAALNQFSPALMAAAKASDQAWIAFRRVEDALMKVVDPAKVAADELQRLGAIGPTTADQIRGIVKGITDIQQATQILTSINQEYYNAVSRGADAARASNEKLDELKAKYLRTSQQALNDYNASLGELERQGNTKAIAALKEKYDQQKGVRDRAYAQERADQKAQNRLTMEEELRTAGEQMQELYMKNADIVGATRDQRVDVLAEIARMTGAAKAMQLLAAYDMEQFWNKLLLDHNLTQEEMAQATLAHIAKIVADIKKLWAGATGPGTPGEGGPTEGVPAPLPTASTAPTERATETMANVMEEISRGITSAMDAFNKVLGYRHLNFERRLQALLDDVKTAVRMFYDTFNVVGKDIIKAAGEFAQGVDSVTGAISGAVDLFDKLGNLKPKMDRAMANLPLIKEFMVQAVNNMMWAGWSFGEGQFGDWRSIPAAAAQMADWASRIMDGFISTFDMMDKLSQVTIVGTGKVHRVFDNILAIFAAINQYWQDLRTKGATPPSLSDDVQDWMAELTNMGKQVSDFFAVATDIFGALAAKVPYDIIRHVKAVIYGLADVLGAVGTVWTENKDVIPAVPLSDEVIKWIGDETTGTGLMGVLPKIAALFTIAQDIFSNLTWAPNIGGVISNILYSLGSLLGEIGDVWLFVVATRPDPTRIMPEGFTAWIDAVQEIVQPIADLMNTVTDLMDSLSGPVKDVSGKWSSFYSALVGVMNEILDTFYVWIASGAGIPENPEAPGTYPTAEEMIAALMQTWTPVIAWLDELGGIAGSISNVLTKGYDIFNALAERLPRARVTIGRFMDRLLGLLTDIQDYYVNAVGSLVPLEYIGPWTQQYYNDLTMWVDALFTIVSPLSDLVSAANSIFNILRDYREIKDLNIQLQNFMDQMIVVMTNLTTNAKVIWDAIGEQNLDIFATFGEYVGKALEGLMNAFEFMTKLGVYISPRDIGYRISAFVGDLQAILLMLSAAAQQWQDDAIYLTADWAEAVGTIVNGIGNAFGFFENLRGYTKTSIGQIISFGNDLQMLLGLLSGIADDFSVESMDTAAKWGESVGKLVDGIAKALNLMLELSKYRAISIRSIQEFESDLYTLMQSFWILMDYFANSFPDTLDAFVDKLSNMVQVLSSALSLLRDIAGTDFTGMASSLTRFMEMVATMFGQVNAMAPATAPAMASGGIAWNPGTYRLAEQGPELVLPARQTAMFLGNQGISIDIRIDRPTVSKPEDLTKMGAVIEEAVEKALAKVDSRIGKQANLRRRFTVG